MPKLYFIMPRSQKNDNFIDKTFTIVADILLRIIPTTQREKEAFTYYRDGAIWPSNPYRNLFNREENMKIFNYMKLILSEG